MISLLGITICYSVGAQKDTCQIFVPTTPQKDIKDAIGLNKKKYKLLETDTVGHNPSGPFISPFLYPGYELVHGYLVGLALNISFYTLKTDSAKLSSILFNNFYSTKNQFVSQITTNLWTRNNKFNIRSDLRYYKFPTATYGLGGNSNTFTPVDYSNIRVFTVVMKNIARNLSAGGGYSLDYHWNIHETSNTFNFETDLRKYGDQSHTLSSGLCFNLQYDSRLNCNNPSRSNYASLLFRQHLKPLGSDNNWNSLILDLRKYILLSKKTGNVLAFWSYSTFTLNGKPPYFDLPSIGWDTYNNSGRGYVAGRFRGMNLIYFETEYRYRILNSGLLGGVIFCNTTTVSDWPSNQFSKIHPGIGFGIRLKMDKNSGSNICLDYGKGTGSNGGLFFNLNEVF